MSDDIMISSWCAQIKKHMNTITKPGACSSPKLWVFQIPRISIFQLTASKKFEIVSSQMVEIIVNHGEKYNLQIDAVHSTCTAWSIDDIIGSFRNFDVCAHIHK